MANPFSLEGKTLLVTGASSGIGRSVAIQCSLMGGEVVISGRNQFRLQETFNMLSDKKGNMMIVADLNINTDIIRISKEIVMVDGIVHCAGITKTVPFQFINESMLAEVMQINFIAPVKITQSLLKNRKIKNGGSIVFISSIQGVYCTSPANSIYSASKGAVNGIVKTLALELSGKEIRVNSINPGMVETSILSDGVITESQILDDVKKYPLKRYGRPDEIAYAVIYFLSDASKWITGSNLLIDGGYTLQ